MLESGFVSLHRSLLDWEWYKDTNTKAVFIHLLLTVNYKPRKWRGIVIERGQRVCSYAGLADELGLTAKEIRTAVKHLISTGEIVWKGKPQYSLVQVVRYDNYQSGANQGQTKGKPGANEGQQFKKDNKANKEINIIPPYNPPREISPEPSSEKVQWAEHVTMTNGEYQSLVATHGEADTLRMIEFLDNYKGASGKRYKSDYRAILSWCVKRLREEAKGQPSMQRKNDYDALMRL